MLFSGSPSFFPTKFRREVRQLQLASRHTRARCPSRAPSCPKAVVLRDRVPYTLATPAGPSRAHIHVRVHSHERLSLALALAIPPDPSHHRLHRSERRHYDDHDFEHCSGRGVRRACEGGRGRKMCCRSRRPFCNRAGGCESIKARYICI